MASTTAFRIVADSLSQCRARCHAALERCLTYEEGGELWRQLHVRRGRDVSSDALSYCDNSITTSKYTLLTFLPRSLFEQFRRTANQYFLFISILMILGTYTSLFYSPLTPFSTIAPLTFILGVTMAKEGVEDLKRHRSDDKVNHTPATIVDGTGHFETVAWKTLAPGRLVWVSDREEIPADLVLLASSEVNGQAYVETSNIDGETNLKIKRSAAHDAFVATTPDGLPEGEEAVPSSSSSTEQVLARAAATDFVVEYEPPCGRIHTFDGTLRVDMVAPTKKEKVVPLEAAHFLLRGSTLRNTKWAIGCVVYTGKDTRLVRNSRDAPSKLSEIERVVNNMVLFILASMVVVCSVSTLAYVVWNSKNKKNLWYLCYRYRQDGVPELFDENCKNGETYADISLWFTFFVLYNNFIPISLYVTIEVINYAMAFYIDNDLRMFDEESQTPAQARTSNANADLGMISHVFSDKTGTLTRNVMRFERCSVNGSVYGAPNATPPYLLTALKQRVVSSPVRSSSTPPEWDLVAIMAVCHTVVPEKSKSSSSSRKLSTTTTQAPVEEAKQQQQQAAPQEEKAEETKAVSMMPLDDQTASETITYQAESPDEEALVKGAADLGLTFKDRVGSSVTVTQAATGGDGGRSLKFDILATIPFDSTRKRMSVVARLPNGKIRVMTKGADSVIFGLSAADDDAAEGDSQSQRAMVEAHLDSFARDGLRTLVLAQRDLSAAEYDAWAQEWHAAETAASSDRATLLALAAQKIERDLHVVGATAIEDRLQDGVPETIAHLAKAGVKVWVLTGDKMETAINVGYSCRLLEPDMYLVKMPPETAQSPGPQGDWGVAKQLDALEAIVQAAAARSPWLARTGTTTTENPVVSVPAAAPSVMADTGTASPRPLLDTSGGGTTSPGVPQTPPQQQQQQQYFPTTQHSSHLALVVEGSTALEAIIGQPELEDRFLRLAAACRAVVACRVSPAQKRLIVKLVKDAPRRQAKRTGNYLAAYCAFDRPITLAIGDGANDVGMIQEAQVGVGISGKEGRQAVNNADFAIAQFRFLKTLMLAHGRRNYRRMAKVIIYSFFKNIVLTFVLFYFQSDCGWSGFSFYESWVYSGYNFFLGLLPFTMGFFDVDITDDTVDRFPRLYLAGLRRMDLNVTNTAYATLEAIVASLMIYYTVRETMLRPRFVWHPHGKASDVWVFGTTVFVAMVAAMAARAVLLTESWTQIGAVCLILQAAMLFTFILFMAQTSEEVDYDYYGVAYHAYGLGTFWLVALGLVPSIVATLQLLVHAIHLDLFPSLNDIGKEIDHGHLDGAHDDHVADLLPPRLAHTVHKILTFVCCGYDALGLPDRQAPTVVTRDSLREVHAAMSRAESVAIGFHDDVTSSFAYDAPGTNLGAGAGADV